MSKLIIDMPKKYLTDASGFVSCAMCQKYLPLLYRDCTDDFRGCLIKGELPEHHDRLVSEKAVRWAIDDIVLEIASRTGRVAMTKNETMEYVNRLPTIVEAERKEDEQIH